MKEKKLNQAKKELLKQINKDILLSTIFLQRSSLNFDDEFFINLENNKEYTYQLKYGFSGSKVIEKENGFNILTKISCGARLVDEESEGIIYAELEADFVIQYIIEILPEKTDLDEYLNYHAPFQVWPYWREYLQNTLHRSNLPNVVLPLLKK